MRAPRSVSQLPCVVLGVDPGKHSGWAIYFGDHHRVGSFEGFRNGMWCGETEDGHRHVVGHAIGLADWAHLPLVVVAEKWTAGGWASHTTLLGLGAAWGAWQVALREARHPKRRIVRVYSQTWRAAVIGGRQRPTEQWKAAAQAHVLHRFGVEAGPDAAEAALIALWGSHAGEVAAVLPKRRRAA